MNLPSSSTHAVLGELAAIAVGTRLLVIDGQAELRPALIAAVVGVHFLPFSWAFGEHMFSRLGAALIVLGVIGLVAGYAGIAHAAAGPPSCRGSSCWFLS